MTAKDSRKNDPPREEDAGSGRSSVDFLQDFLISRFVSQNELDDAKVCRDEQWRQAYAMCAVQPPQPGEMGVECVDLVSGSRRSSQRARLTGAASQMSAPPPHPSVPPPLASSN
jgi:hypothetical protein